MSPYKDFTARLKLLISKNPYLITTMIAVFFFIVSDNLSNRTGQIGQVVAV